MMNMQATFHNEDGSKTTYQGEQAWGMIQARSKPYAGAPKLKQLPATKANYRGKNAAGGRKCIFSQSRDYTLKDPLEAWYRRYIYAREM